MYFKPERFSSIISASPAGEVPPMKGLDDLPIAVDSRTTKTPKTTTIVVCICTSKF